MRSSVCVCACVGAAAGTCPPRRGLGGHRRAGDGGRGLPFAGGGGGDGGQGDGEWGLRRSYIF